MSESMTSTSAPASTGAGMPAELGIPATDLDDVALRREVAHLHETRHQAMLDAGESAFERHTSRMLELEAEYLRRFPVESAPDPQRTRAGSRAGAGQPVPGRDLDGAPG